MHRSKIRLATRKRHAVFPRTMLMPCPKTLAITRNFPGGRGSPERSMSALATSRKRVEPSNRQPRWARIVRLRTATVVACQS